MDQPQYAPPVTPQFPTPPANRPRAPWIAARIAVGALAASAIVAVITAMTTIARFEERVTDARSASDKGPGAVDVASFGTLVLSAVVFCVTAVSFVVWLYQARRNIDRLGGSSKWGKGWTVGAWFIPFANLVIPYKVVKDVAEESVPAAAPEDAGGLRNAPIGWWWAAWVVMWVLDRVDTMHTNAIEARPAATVAELVADRPMTFVLALGSAVTAVAAATFGSIVVLRITRAQEIHAGLRARAAVTAPEL